MNVCRATQTTLSLITFFVLITGCGGSSDGSTDTDTESDPLVADADINPVDLSLFITGALVSSDEVSCTVSGTTTTCYELVIAGFPADQADLGEFCPETTTTSADDAGIWFDGGGDIYDLSGAFMDSSALFDLYSGTYGGDWDFSDDDVTIKVTDTLADCQAAAVPNVPEAYANYCVECNIDEVGVYTTTVTIPTTPISATSTGSVGNDVVGTAFNGVRLDAPAPAAAILGGITIAAFDDCAGHVNPNVGYHYHGANLCSEGVAESDIHSSAFGYALDGFLIYSNTEVALGGDDDSDLDSCRGHSDDIRGYHYHAAGTGENMFIGCYSGGTAQ